MKKTISRDEFIRDLLADDYANWTANGAAALFDYLEELEDSTGTEIEFDRVALRCDYSEYPSLQDWASDYFVDWRKGLNIPDHREESSRADALEKSGELADAMQIREQLQDEIDDAIRDYIRDYGELIEFDGGIIVSSSF